MDGWFAIRRSLISCDWLKTTKLVQWDHRRRVKHPAWRFLDQR
jgi:hypothetical protein